MTKVDGIPVVATNRLLVNLAATETPTVVSKLIDEAEHWSPIDFAALREVADELRNGGGYAVIDDALTQYEHGQFGTDSELEERALAFYREQGVREPACNVYMRFGKERARTDQVWEGERVIGEVDGHGHRRPTRRRRDQRVRRAARADGWGVFVLTPEILDDPTARDAAGQRLRNMLHRGAATARRSTAVRTTAVRTDEHVVMT